MITCARWLREDLEFPNGEDRPRDRLQDRYSLRCAPQVIGVALDSLSHARGLIETALNSDNPILDPESGEVLFGGNFYGGHICYAMDSLKNTIANLADLIDRQLALLCTPRPTPGCPRTWWPCPSPPVARTSASRPCRSPVRR